MQLILAVLRTTHTYLVAVLYIKIGVYTYNVMTVLCALVRRAAVQFVHGHDDTPRPTQTDTISVGQRDPRKPRCL